MAKPELGTKRIDPETGRKFYDLNKRSDRFALHRQVLSALLFRIPAAETVERRGGRGRGRRSWTSRRARRSCHSRMPTKRPRAAATTCRRSRTMTKSTWARRRRHVPGRRRGRGRRRRRHHRRRRRRRRRFDDRRATRKSGADLILRLAALEAAIDAGKAPDLAGTRRLRPAWGHSSAGRALAWHARGQRFDPAWLHHPHDHCIDFAVVLLI